MVLDGLDFFFDGLRTQPKKLQQLRQRFVAHLDVIGHGAAFGSQSKAAIFLIIDKAAPGKPANHVGNRRAAQGKRGGNVGDARVSLALDQFLYPFQMVLR
jgi:hypothetical protein